MVNSFRFLNFTILSHFEQPHSTKMPLNVNLSIRDANNEVYKQLLTLYEEQERLPADFPDDQCKILRIISLQRLLLRRYYDLPKNYGPVRVRDIYEADRFQLDRSVGRSCPLLDELVYHDSGLYVKEGEAVLKLAMDRLRSQQTESIKWNRCPICFKLFEAFRLKVNVPCGHITCSNCSYNWNENQQVRTGRQVRLDTGRAGRMFITTQIGPGFSSITYTDNQTASFTCAICRSEVEKTCRTHF